MNRHWFKFLRVAGVGLAAVLMSEQAISVPMNLIPNGDFESGNSGFVSGYEYIADDPNLEDENTTERQYTVTKNPNPWNKFFVSAEDHTSGSGKLFVGNGGKDPEDVVWSTEIKIDVKEDTNYFFQAWVMNVCCNETFNPSSVPPEDYDRSKPLSPAKLSFLVNDDLLGELGTDLLGKWEPLSTMWYSGNNTEVNLVLKNANLEPEGNDFGVDDIYFGTESSIVPEPGTLVLLGLGLIGLGVARRRKAA